MCSDTYSQYQPRRSMLPPSSGSLCADVSRAPSRLITHRNCSNWTVRKPQEDEFKRKKSLLCCAKTTAAGTVPCTRTGLLLGRPARRPRIASHNDAAQHGGLTTTLAGCCTNTLGRHSAEGLAGDSQFKVTLWRGHQSGRRSHNRFRLAFYNRPTQRHVVHGELRTDMTGRTLHMLTKEAWLVVQQVVLWRTVLPPGLISRTPEKPELPKTTTTTNTDGPVVADVADGRSYR